MHRWSGVNSLGLTLLRVALSRYWLAALRCLSIAAIGIFVIVASGGPARAAPNALCSDDGSTADCADVTSDGILYDTLDTINVEGSVPGTATVTTGTVGIELLKEGGDAPFVSDAINNSFTFIISSRSILIRRWRALPSKRILLLIFKSRKYSVKSFIIERTGCMVAPERRIGDAVIIHPT